MARMRREAHGQDWNENPETTRGAQADANTDAHQSFHCYFRFVAGGAPVHLSGGETFSPSQVYFAGMDWPSPNAVLVGCIVLSPEFSAAFTIPAQRIRETRLCNRPALRLAKAN